jgi:hypothetical protein
MKRAVTPKQVPVPPPDVTRDWYFKPEALERSAINLGMLQERLKSLISDIGEGLATDDPQSRINACVLTAEALDLTALQMRTLPDDYRFYEFDADLIRECNERRRSSRLAALYADRRPARTQRQAHDRE